MTKKNRHSFSILFICIGLIALVLAVFFSTAAELEKPKHTHPISVILYAAGNNGWESLQEGLKRAEDDFPVQLNYVMLRENAGPGEQIEIIEREIENGAEGIILAVNDYETLNKLWLERSFLVPVVTVESGFGESGVPLISADNYEMGKLLGEEILHDFAGEERITVMLKIGNMKRDSMQQRAQGFYDALQGKAKIIAAETAAVGAETSTADAGNAEKTPGIMADAAAALDKEGLQELVTDTESGMEEIKKYGIGSTAFIVAALDQGKIEKIVFQNEFNMGYLAVEAIVGELGSSERRSREVIDFYSVKGEDIYNPPYEQLLFPIVE